MNLPIDPSARQEKMIKQQIIARGIRDPRVIEAMKWLPRERFLPEEIQGHAFDDAPAQIGHGQTISQPYIVALMTEALRPEPDHRVLEIGTGSGYQTSVLARLTGEVYTVERIKSLLDESFERIMSLGIRNVHFHFGDGSLGWPKHGPYDRIIVTAAAPSLPRGLADQLVDGGVCIAPIGDRTAQQLMRYVKTPGGLEQHAICGVRFVPLIGQDGWES
ncbi:MAG: protein-L-isoaspartate(D-aspartate) O-methyltransferase [Burkholderiales bacterium]|nr:protein-L-isoaspartate(D-aspartate) O-methyltransferase [Phycisphaerae bacterium]